MTADTPVPAPEAGSERHLTLVSAWTAARRQLEAAGVDTPVLDARLLVEAATGLPRSEIVTNPHRPLDPAAATALDALLARRAGREPISHIVGRKPFWTIEVEVGPDVLTPRPETELLVEAGLALTAHDRPARVLEYGVGSGAVLLALLKERPLARAVGVELSAAAAARARRNAGVHALSERLEVVVGDWAAGAPDGADVFDLILANPPYIPSADIDGLEPEVARFEPRLALDGGPDGLDAYRALAPEIARRLAPDGGWAVEIGVGQDPDVAALMAEAGLVVAGVRADLSGRGRVVFGRAKRSASPLGAQKSL